MRQHTEHLLAALGALGFALFISYYSTGGIFHVPQHLTATTSPSSSVSKKMVVPAPTLTIPTSTLESLFPTHPAATPAAKTSKPTPTSSRDPSSTPPNVPRVVVPSAPTPTKPINTAVATSTTSEPSTTATYSPILASLKNSIVNILCIANDGALHSTSGSGVLVDSRGIILTVAHIGQSTLLQEYLGSDKVSCVVRMGSPASPLYFARPVYVSEAWVKANPTTLISSQPMGTGEHDFAFLAITGTVNGTPLPASFPAVPLSYQDAQVGAPVSIGSYGAQGLSNAAVRNALFPTLVTSTVDSRYTLGTNTVDVLSIAGSKASQEGSSGGAVVNDSGELIGIITTSEIQGDVSSRKMRVITPSYILRDFQASTGQSFASYFGTGNTGVLVTFYSTTAKRLGEFLARSSGLE